MTKPKKQPQPKTTAADDGLTEAERTACGVLMDLAEADEAEALELLRQAAAFLDTIRAAEKRGVGNAREATDEALATHYAAATYCSRTSAAAALARERILGRAKARGPRP